MPVGFGADRGGRRKRLYDKPAKIAREISDLQVLLLKLAKNKTEQL